MGRSEVLALVGIAACVPQKETPPEPTPVVHHAMGAGRTPIIPPSWTVPNWYVDPAMSVLGAIPDAGADAGVDGSGMLPCASDNNNCTSATCGSIGSNIGPCLTWHEIYDGRLGCQGAPLECPRTRQNTNYVFLSSQSGNGDPVYIHDAIENGALRNLQGGSPTVVATGVVLSGVSAKSRAVGSNAILIANLGASAAVGQLVENTTHPSRAWVYRALGGNSFELSQPMAKNFAASALLAPAEVDTWANGDSVNLLTPVAVNLVDTQPVITDLGGSFTGQAWIWQLSVLNPGIAEQINVGRTRFAEVSLNRTAVGNYPVGPNFLNCWVRGANLVGNVSSGGFVAYGGVITGFPSLAGAALDGDVIIGSSWTLYPGLTQMGLVFLDGTVKTQNTFLQFQSTAYSLITIYGRTGSSQINLMGTTHATVVSGTFAAALTAPDRVSPGIQINGASTGCSHSGGSPDVVSCGIATTPNNLDMSQSSSAFGGNAFVPGGAGISNFR